ncbi:MAG: serine/threonine protein kinase [Burkholderiales bacterium]|nr:serine/threonine protein kinase [Burkholderiales bacterium]
MSTNTIPPSTTPGSALPISRVGRFYLTEKIGKGSNGSVFLGHDPVIDRDVAIKILIASGGASDKRQREQQFINEARAAGRLSHPNIVTIYDASSEGGTTFIAMEFLQGQDLRHLLAAGSQFDIIETANIIRRIADALAYAHTHGVIHRDIKPANIFILPNKQPKVVDFGIARSPNRILDESGQPEPTLFNTNILGTPNYMSPEQAGGKPVSAQTDIYSLGAVMYEMLTRQKPFQTEEINKLLHQIIHKIPKAPSDIAPNVPASLSRIVMKAMQKNPAERYQNAAEMSLALQKFLARDKKLKRNRSRPENHSASAQQNPNGKPSFSWISWSAIAIAALLVLISLFR